MSLSRQYSFWGSLSPLGGLMGAGLLIMASARLSWAITIAGCLFWVYGFTALVFSSLLNSAGDKIFPVKGKAVIYTCLASFFGAIYIFLFWLLCPFVVFENFMLLCLVPLFCASSGIVEQVLPENARPDVFEHVSDAVSQAASLAGLIIVFSIVREPLSYCSLSFPGTFQGMLTIMYFTEGAFFPIGIFGSSAGALLLLGYIICLYQSSKGNKGE
ncbi:MAG: hypothetical protein FWC01_01225 [Treponema sp.]|nr:hypothetical protein [Treponema sp.]MCL2236766.1 hypothetical protein [Treponema sp.]